MDLAAMGSRGVATMNASPAEAAGFRPTGAGRQWGRGRVLGTR